MPETSPKLDRLMQSLDNSKSFLSMEAAEQAEVKRKYQEASTEAEIAEAQKMLDEEAELATRVAREQKALDEEKQAAVKELRVAMARVKKVELEMAAEKDEQESQIQAKKLLTEVETLKTGATNIPPRWFRKIALALLVLALLGGFGYAVLTVVGTK